MFALTRTLALTLSLIVGTSAFAGDKDKVETPERFQSLPTVIQDALHGKNLDQTRRKIASDAYFVDGGFFVSLHEVFSHKEVSIRLDEGNQRQIAFLQSHIADDGSEGSMFIKTESLRKTEPRFHTINFVKPKDGEFFIKDWHSSN